MKFGSAQLSHNFHDLADFRLGSEKDASLGKFVEDTPERPDIDLQAVLDISEEKFGSPVPKGLDFLGHGFEHRGDDPPKSEVGNFDFLLFCLNQDILGLEVPVEDLAFVHVLHSQHNLVHNLLF